VTAGGGTLSPIQPRAVIPAQAGTETTTSIINARTICRRREEI
jgi:hypothetical protein